MSVFNIALKDLRLLLRDRKALLTLLGTPLILTLVLGTALSNMWTAETPASRILYINEDTGDYGGILFDEVFTLPGISEWVRLEEVSDRAEALGRVQQGRATVLIEVPATFSLGVEAGDAELSVYRDPGSSIRADAIVQIVDRFTMELAARRAVYRALTSQGLPLDPLAVEQSLASVAIHIRAESIAGEVNPGARPLIPMDYYAAGMGVMYLLFAVSHGATTFLREREGGTLARMYQSPIPAWTILGGKFVGIFLVALTQMTAVIFFTRVAYGVHWGNPLAAAALT